MNKTINTLAAMLLTANIAQADVVHLDDVIVDGHLCVGADCVNGENFGFDNTLRIKQNNVRIDIDDTSSSGSFPNNDWRFTFNDSSNGGLNKFSIDDVTGNKVPFTIEAGAANHSLYIADNGNVGIGTSTPALEVHIADGNTPSLRLEQNGAEGWTPQTWDIAGNESNFFIRDVTNGSQLPFRIKPGAHTDSLVIGSTNDIGLGIINPLSSLHVKRSDGSAKVLVEEVNTTSSARTLFEIKNKGNTKFTVNNTDAGVAWAFANSGNDFRLSRQGSGVVEFVLSNAGNLTIQGNLTELSSRTQKHNIVAMSSKQALNKVLTLPIKEWSYKDSQQGTRHIGPMAEDFYAAFGLGESEKGIATLDTSGVALAAIQGLKAEKDAEIAILKAEKDAEIVALRSEQMALQQSKSQQDSKLAEQDKTMTAMQSELAELKALVQRLAVKDQWAALN